MLTTTCTMAITQSMCLHGQNAYDCILTVVKAAMHGSVATVFQLLGAHMVG